MLILMPVDSLLNWLPISMTPMQAKPKYKQEFYQGQVIYIADAVWVQLVASLTVVRQVLEFCSQPEKAGGDRLIQHLHGTTALLPRNALRDQFSASTAYRQVCKIANT